MVKNCRYKIRTPFSRIGGKSQLRAKILPLIPEHKTYVEPFVGGGTIFFGKRGAQIEVLNDLDDEVATTLKVFQNTDGQTISDRINGTYSKEDFETLKGEDPTGKSDFDRAVRFLKMSKLSFQGNHKQFISAKPYIRSKYSARYKERLNGVTILNEDYRGVIERYDGVDTFFYLDPPYTKSKTKHYVHHKVSPNDVLECVRNIKGKFLLSYNDCPEVRELFKQYTVTEVQTTYSGKKKKLVTELLIRNY